MKTLLATLSLLLAFTLSACSKNAALLSPQDTTAWLASHPDAQIIDVRKPDEFATGHLDKAALVTYAESFNSAAKSKLDPEKPVLVYCRSGHRSALAAKVLEELGFPTVRQLKGGIIAWKDSGNPVTSPN